MQTGTSSSDSRDRVDGRDRLVAAGLGALALALYVRTLAPGLVADVDSAMFQFVGRVLGVAHNPGYPLYVLLTHPIAQLPFGSLAYRINLFSAVLGATTVGLVYLVIRVLRCRRVVAAAAALGLGVGHIFWSQAVIAEVYTLHAAIISGMLLVFASWERSRRPVLYFAGVAFFALGLGNHTTIVGFAPGIALFVVLTDAAFARRTSTLLATGVILLGGLSQYGFVLLRSRDPAAYVESRAATVGDLAHVVMGGQFRDRLFAFDAHTLVTERLPTVVGQMLVPDLAVVGALFAVVGVAWLVRYRLRHALLLLGGGLAVFVFAVNYDVIDTAVFLIPTLVVLWIASAVGADRTIARLALAPRLRTAAAGLMLLMPLGMLGHNFARTDRSGDTAAAVQLDRLFDALPPSAAIVSEDFIADRMVTFESLAGRGAERGLHIELAPRDPVLLRSRFEQGIPVFAFRKAAGELRAQGLEFGFEPVHVAGESLERYLARLPGAAVVAIAVPGRLSEAFAGAAGVSLASIGIDERLTPHLSQSIVIIGVRGARGAQVQVVPYDVRLPVSRGRPVGNTGVSAPAAIEPWSNVSEAGVRQGSRDVVRSGSGVSVAVWDSGGRRVDSFVLDAHDAYRVPAAPGSLSAFRLKGVFDRDELGRDWRALDRIFRSGNAVVSLAPGTEAELFVADDAPLAPRVFGSSESANVEVSRAELRSEPPARLPIEADDAADHDSGYRVVVRASAAAPASATIALGGVPSHARGRLTPSSPPVAASIYGVPVNGLLRPMDSATSVLRMGRDEQAQLVGHGWSDVDWDAVSPYRWLTAPRARVLLPAMRSRLRRIRLQVLRTPDARAAALRVQLNGAELPWQPLQTGWHTYEWSVPDDAVTSAMSEAFIDVDRLEDRAGRTPKDVAVTELAVIHDVDE